LILLKGLMGEGKGGFPHDYGSVGVVAELR
jgi:hypothetical protein